MISDIRAYFKSVIKEIDSDLKENKIAISEPIASRNKIEDSFSIIIGGINSTKVETYIDGDVNVTVEIFAIGKNNIIENFDKGYCKALNIQSTAMDGGRIAQQSSFQSVSSSGIKPESIEDNDNIYKYTIDFNVRVIYYKD